MSQLKIHGTTILGIVKDNRAVIGGDGQITLGDTILKNNTTKIRKLYEDSVLVGFAGATADALILLDEFEGKLNEYNGNIERAAVELAKKWRSDKYLMKLEAMLAVLDEKKALIISGSGDIIEPEDGIVAIGSGGPYALAAAKAFLMSAKKMKLEKIVEESLKIAASICIYTNNNIKVYSL